MQVTGMKMHLMLLRINIKEAFELLEHATIQLFQWFSNNQRRAT